eukprot:maker-scaffold_24-snap-gene-5.54-mRNA-1 protein AED:0.41 eAED:0.41 QI:0/0/0/0.5/1/1/2/0/1777
MTKENTATSALIQLFPQNSTAYIPNNQNSLYTPVKVLTQTKQHVTVRTLDQIANVLTVNLLEEHLLPGNPPATSSQDLTSLTYLNEATILTALEDRSYSDNPYTFMANVLIAVNPIKRLNREIGLDECSPYSVAERALQQLKFRKTSQSLVTSGESGAGKTESAKMLLKHVLLKLDSSDEDLSLKLLQSNVILESFGNSGTLRNHNSSRFGKFIKLMLDKDLNKVLGVEIETYLLEKSRITMHNEGEYNYHIFYYLLKLSDEDKEKYFLNKDFKYLGSINENTKSRRNDVETLSDLKTAFIKFGFDDNMISSIFGIVSGILHLGNVILKEEFINNETIVKEDSESNVLETISKVWDVNKELLENTLTTKEITIGKDTNVVKLSLAVSEVTRDSLAKIVYAKLFHWIVGKLSSSMNSGNSLSDESSKFVGILDIFGFEVFEQNTFEQLLINYTNEALQQIFNKAIFLSELNLYKEEGLISDDSEVDSALDATTSVNEQTLELFRGISTSGGDGSTKMRMSKLSRVDALKRKGLLKIIEGETLEIKSSDEKLCGLFHRVFDKHPSFGRLHPIERRNKFVIKHYSGLVIYEIESFISKNRDSYPKGLKKLLSASSNVILRELADENESKTKAKKKQKTVVGGFSKQMKELVKTLEATDLSFIRCLKPNESLWREDTNDWFNRKYVLTQLRNLSIVQTVQVLSNGYPTRLDYETLMKQFQPLAKLVGDETKRDAKDFVQALFYAFGIGSGDYKLGFTKVFFKSGQLPRLMELLAGKSEDGNDVKERFQRFYVRRKWRKGFVKVLAINKFIKVLNLVREREVERKRKEEIRKKLVRKRWRIAITGVRFGLELIKVFEAVKQKRKELAEEEARRKEEERLRLEEEKKKEEERIAEEKRKEKERLDKEYEEERLRKLEELKKIQADIEEEERKQREEEDRQLLAIAQKAHVEFVDEGFIPEKPGTPEAVLETPLTEKPVSTVRLKKNTDFFEDLIDAEEELRTTKVPKMSFQTDAGQVRESNMTSFDFRDELFKSSGRKKKKQSTRLVRLDSLNRAETVLDPFKRLNRLKTMKRKMKGNRGPSMTEEDMLKKAKRAVSQLRRKRQKDNEKMHRQMEMFANQRFGSDQVAKQKFLGDFETKLEKAKEKDQKDYDRLVQVELKKIKLKYAVKEVKKKQDVSSILKEEKESFNLFDSDIESYGSDSDSEDSVDIEQTRNRMIAKRASVIAINLVRRDERNLKESFSRREREEEINKKTNEIIEDLADHEDNQSVFRAPWFKQANQQAYTLLRSIKKPKKKKEKIVQPPPPVKGGLMRRLKKVTLERSKKKKPIQKTRKRSALDEANVNLTIDRTQVEEGQKKKRALNMNFFGKKKEITATSFDDFSDDSSDEFGSDDELDFEMNDIFKVQPIKKPAIPMKKRIRRNGFQVDRFVVIDEDPSEDNIIETTKQQFNNLDQLARQGELSPEELLTLKHSMAKEAKTRNMRTRNFRRKSVMPGSVGSSYSHQTAVTASVAIACKKCGMTNVVDDKEEGRCSRCKFPLVVEKKLSTWNGEINTSIRSTFEPGAGNKVVALHNRTVEDENKESEYYDSVKWDLDVNVLGGNLRLALMREETKNKTDPRTEKEKTYFTTLCVFSRNGKKVSMSEYKKRKGSMEMFKNLFSGKKKDSFDDDFEDEAAVEVDASKYISWRVLHSFGDFVAFNSDLHDENSHIGGLLSFEQRKLMTNLVGTKELFEEHNFFFFGNTLKIWFDNLQKALFSDEVSVEFFKEAGYFWELHDNIDFEDFL